jgi:integrase
MAVRRPRRRQLRVAQTVATIGNALAWSDSAKTDAGARAIALDPATVAALRAHRAGQLEERFAMGPAWHDDEHGPLVFTRPDGAVVHPNRFNEGLRRHAQACGLPSMSVHGLCHSYATAARKAGVLVEVLSERLGHADVAITLNLYWHVDADEHT